jgi:sialate O-acetylesterase
VLDFGMGGGLLDLPVLRGPGAEVPLRSGWVRQVSAANDKVGDRPLRLDRNIRHPTQLFNGLIAPLGSLPLKGVLWYQGESNAGEPEVYRKLLPAMIADWRQRFASPDLPFGIVQLANRQAVQVTPVQHGWAAFRDAQRAVATDVPHCGLAVTIDIGEADSIHPLNKQDVGRRLARWAAADVYAVSGIHAHGPRYQSHEVLGSSLRIVCDGAELRVRGGGTIKGFAIAGEDRTWRFADAIITDRTVTLSAAAVPKPVAARYAWANNPVANVEDVDGLPLEPFRTDNW